MIILIISVSLTLLNIYFQVLEIFGDLPKKI